MRGLQVVEHACSIPSLLMGETLPVSKDMDTYTIRQPLGVVGGIMPFNFPAMIPLVSLCLAFGRFLNSRLVGLSPGDCVREYLHHQAI